MSDEVRNRPTAPGWYPHRYGDENKQSWWKGGEWTGDPTTSSGQGGEGFNGT